MSIPEPKRNEKAKSTRSLVRLAFNLRSFLLGVLTLGILIGLWQSRLEPLRQEWRDAKPLLEVAELEIGTEPVKFAEWLTWVLPEGQREHIEMIRLPRCKYIDKSKMIALTKLPRLKRLYLERTAIGDSHCQYISKIDSLERLAVWGNYQIHDQGVAELAKLPNLKVIDLKETGVTWRAGVMFRPEVEVRGLQPSRLIIDDQQDLRLTSPLAADVKNVLLKSSEKTLAKGVIDQFPNLYSIGFSLNESVSKAILDELLRTRTHVTLNYRSITAEKNAPHFSCVQNPCETFCDRITAIELERQDQDMCDLKMKMPHNENGTTSVKWLKIYPPRNFCIREKDVSRLPSFRLAKSLRTKGDLPFSELLIVNQTPYVEQVFFAELSNLPSVLVDELHPLEKLESIGFSSRLPWQEIKLPAGFFTEAANRFPKLERVTLNGVDCTLANLKPLTQIATLKEINVLNQRFTSIEKGPVDVLPLLLAESPNN